MAQGVRLRAQEKENSARSTRQKTDDRGQKKECGIRNAEFGKKKRRKSFECEIGQKTDDR